jgi:hypothetical protein
MTGVLQAWARRHHVVLAGGPTLSLRIGDHIGVLQKLT